MKKNKIIKSIGYFSLLGAIVMFFEDIIGTLVYITIALFCFLYIKNNKAIENINKNDILNKKTSKKCTQCKKIIDNADIFCKYCGYKFKNDLNITDKKNTDIPQNESNIITSKSLNSPILIKGKKVLSLYRNNNIKEFVDDYVVFDLETTGFEPYYDQIIEIGALKYKNNQLIDSFNVLINPQIPIPRKITEITGIKTTMIKGCNTIDIELKNFIEFIEDYPLIAHNASFDIGFIEANINNLNLETINNKNIDTLYLARKYINGVENHKLETLKKYFKLKNKSHRALEDCYVTNYLYQYCKNYETPVKYQ